MVQGALRRRAEAWLRALEAAERTGDSLSRRLGGATVVLHGSYARGDFNLWSDVDLIVVSDRFRGVRILDRYDIVADLLEPGVEPVLLTVEELRSALRKPAWRQALSRGAVLVRDDYGVSGEVERLAGVRLVPIGVLKERIRRMLEGSEGSRRTLR